MRMNDVRYLSVIILKVFTTIFQLSAQKILHETPREIPFVYSLENSVAPTTVHLPTFEELQVIETLPDPFAWSDGSGRSTRFEDWSRRRMEIVAEIQALASLAMLWGAVGCDTV